MATAPTIGKAISFSWGRTKEILFPVDLKRWFKVLIITSFAMVGVGGCNLNWQTPEQLRKSEFFQLPQKFLPRGIPRKLPRELLNPQIEQQKASERADLWAMGEKNHALRSSQVSSSVNVREGTDSDTASSFPYNKWTPTEEQKQRSSKIANIKKKTPSKHLQRKTISPVVLGWIFGFGVPLFLGGTIFVAWVSARFNFILLDMLVAGKSAIRESFSRWREQGMSYFRWSLGFIGVIISFVLIFSGLEFLVLRISQGNSFILIALTVILVILAGLVLLIAGVISILVRDFVLPSVYRSKDSVMTSCRKVFSALKNQKMECLKYLLLILGFGFIASIIQTVGLFIVGAIAVVPVFIVATILLSLFGAVSALFLKILIAIFGCFLILMIALAIAIAAGMLLLPVVIFLRMFALTYLARLYPEGDLLGFSKKIS